MQSSIHPETAAAAKEVLQRSDKPLPVATIRLQLAGSYRVPPKLAPALKTLLATTQGLYEWPKARFWTRDPKVVGETAVLEAAATPLSRSALNKAFTARVKAYGAYPAAARDELIAGLIRDRRLFEDPPWGGHGALLSATTPDGERFRQALEGQLTPVLKRYALAGLDPRPLVDRICAPAANDLADRIFEALNSIEPRKGLVVSAHRLRRAPELPPATKVEFDEAVMRLFAQRRVFLHDHGAPFAVSASEREELVTDGKGRFYVGIAWRDPSESAGIVS